MQINEFDLSTLIELLRRKSKRIVVNAVAAGVAGFLIAWCIPKMYVSDASIIPEADESAGAMGGMSSLASMAGIDLGTGTDAIGPDLYPTVVASNNFVVDLLYTRVCTLDGKEMDFMSYLKEECRMPWWDYGKVYFNRLMKLINPPQQFVTRGADERINPERLSLDDYKLVEGVKGLVGCQMDDKSGVISISMSCQDPLVAKTMVDTIMNHLQNFITNYRTSKACNDLEYYKNLETETAAAYVKTQRAYATYCDSHQGTLLQAYQAEQESLENDMSLALNAYNQVRQQVQMAEAKVQEKTPAFTVVEASSVPVRHASPHKMLMAFAFMFLAGLGTMAWYYVRLLFGKE